MRHTILFALFLAASCAWGDEYGALRELTNGWNRYNLFPTLDSVISRLDRIEARLDAKPKATEPVWSVEPDTVGALFTEYPDPDAEDSCYYSIDWHLYVTKGSRKFRVCKIELMEE